MMVGTVTGQRVTRKVAVTATAVQIEAASDKKVVTLESVTICNTSGATRTVSLYVDKSGTQFPILGGASLIAGATVILDSHAVVLTAGEKLMAVASGAGVTAVAVLIQSTQIVPSDNASVTLSTQAKK